MKEMLDKLMAWIKSNLLIAVGIAVALVLVIFSKGIKKLFRRPVRHHRSRYVTRIVRKNKRSLPRSVGTKGRRVKKPWQVKGSLAAKRHMAQIRKMR